MNRRSLIIGLLIAPFARLFGKTEQQMVVTGGIIKVDDLTVAHACSCVPSVPFPAGFTLDANNRVILCPHGKAMTFTACFNSVDWAERKREDSIPEEVIESWNRGEYYSIPWNYGTPRPWPHSLTFKTPARDRDA